MTWGDDVLTVLPGTLPYEALDRAAEAMRRRRHHEARAQFRESPRAAFAAAGLYERAIYVERGTMAGEIMRRWRTSPTTARPISRWSCCPRPGAAAMSGALYVIGLGPGPADWLTPEAAEALARVTDVCRL